MRSASASLERPVLACALAIVTFPTADAAPSGAPTTAGDAVHVVNFNRGVTGALEGTASGFTGPAHPAMARTETTVTLDLTSTRFKAPVTFHAEVSAVGGPARGRVTFSSGSVTLCTTPSLVDGAGSCRASSAPSGVDVVVANYSGSNSSLASSGTAALVVHGGPNGVTIVSVN